jgi:acyl-CoA synthetase (NDP forming)
MADILNNFFYGRSLAIIGASTDPTKLGGRPLRMNKELNYRGALYPVHPTATSVQGLPAINSIAGLPDGAVDCALVAVPQSAVKGALEALAAKHVPLAIILSSGFAEHSAEGAKLQDELTEIARRSHMRIVGPNSMGGISFETGVCATFTSVSEHESRTYPQLGTVSIASQSGFIGSHLMGLLRDRGIGIAKWLATGNQADIDIADVIQHYANDDISRVIAVYVEGVKNADALRDALEAARRRGKSVVALKVGRTDLGARAIASHTAALVGNTDAYDAVFRRHGVISAESLDDLADLVAALDTGRDIPGRRLGIATVSGGFGILMSDVAASLGMELPELPQAKQDSLRDYYSLASTQNPVDMGSLSRIGPAVETLLTEPFDAVAIGCGHFGLIDSQIATLTGELEAYRLTHPRTFIGLTAMLTDASKRRVQDIGVFTCEDPSRLVATMARLARRTNVSSRDDVADIPTIPDFDEAVLRAAVDERSARALLRDCGIPVATEALARSRAEAVAAAHQIAGKVVLKIASADILHKSEVGGVLLGLEGDDAVGDGFDLILSRAAASQPHARIDGVLVSPMIERGLEILVGFTSDPVFGPIVAVGLGGIFVETLKDKAVELAPFGRRVALEMITSLRGADVLRGARGLPPVNLEALADIVSRISAFAAKYSHVVESLEINPLIAHPSGITAVDALLIPKHRQPA